MKKLLKSVSCFSLKSPIFIKLNASIYIRVLLLRYFTLVCLVHISIYYFLCNVAKIILPAQ